MNCNPEQGSNSDFVGIAIRLALILGINTRDHSDSVMLDETKIRVWCTLYMGDRWCSTRLGITRMIGDFDGLRELPMDEYSFHNLGTDQDQWMINRQPGLRAHTVTLATTFILIHDLNQRLPKEDVTREDLDLSIGYLSQRLDSWEETLPLEIKMTETNLETYRIKGLGGAFVALYLGFHHYSTLLYFHFLDSQSSPGNKLYADRCKVHALRYNSLLRTARQLEGCEAVYPTVGQMAMVSSAVLLHTLMFGNEDELPDTRSSLRSNFEALIELKKYWPISLGKTVSSNLAFKRAFACAVEIERLFSFQDMCLASANLNTTHKIDKWMVRFLLEHSLLLYDKMPAAGGSLSLAEFAVLSNAQKKLTEEGRLMDNALSELLTT